MLACGRNVCVSALAWGLRPTCSARGCELEGLKPWGVPPSCSLGIGSAWYVELSLFTGKIGSTEGQHRTDESHLVRDVTASEAHLCI